VHCRSARLGIAWTPGSKSSADRDTGLECSLARGDFNRLCTDGTSSSAFGPDAFRFFDRYSWASNWCHWQPQSNSLFRAASSS